MADKFERLSFTKDWNNSSDFPTYEENEAQVRADMQSLHDEVKDFINDKLIPSIENMAVPGTGDMLAEIYDPHGRRTDVYAFVEDRIKNDNLVRNGYFANPVNQRGGELVVPPNTPWFTSLSFNTMGGETDGYYVYTPYNDICGSIQIGDVTGYVAVRYLVRRYVGEGYTIDSWKLNGGSLIIDGGVSWTGENVLFQVFEYPLNDGLTRTFSYLDANGDVFSGELTAGYTEVGNVAITHNNSNILYVVSKNADFKIIAVKLELGNTQTLAHQDENGNWVLSEIPDYNEELLRCCMSTADPSDDYANNKRTALAINALAVNKRHFSGTIDEFFNGVCLAMGSTLTGDLPWVTAWFDLIAFPSGTGAVSQIAMCTSEEGVPTTLKFRHYNGTVWSPWSTTATVESSTKIQTGTYTGTGTYGANNPNSLTFTFVPKMVVVLEDNVAFTGHRSGFVWVGQNGGTVKFALAGQTLSWYTTSNDDYAPNDQMNRSGGVYKWVAIG